MKYMGSKRSMLKNGLADTLAKEVNSSTRFIDLFSGSGVVSWHVATNYAIPVHAVDLQSFAKVVAAAVICRDRPINPQFDVKGWLENSQRQLHLHPQYPKFLRIQKALSHEKISLLAKRARDISGEMTGFTITQSYGGYYFSPLQALSLDILRTSLPKGPAGLVALAALIHAGSKCAASPGHTAQPFKPNLTAGKFLVEAWKRSVHRYVLESYDSISNIFAKRRGKAVVQDALSYCKKLKCSDLIFIDPPYSDVQYSRFYHVLETLASDRATDVSGEGRYPPFEERPQSDFSLKSRSRNALEALLIELGSRGVRVILTFPRGQASNGLSGEQIEEIAGCHYQIKKRSVVSLFSTLGGNSIHREARQSAQELILTLYPK